MAPGPPYSYAYGLGKCRVGFFTKSLLAAYSAEMDFYLSMCQSGKLSVCKLMCLCPNALDYLLFRVKNIVSVTKSMSVCSKISTITLSLGERDLLASVGIHLVEPVRCYS